MFITSLYHPYNFFLRERNPIHCQILVAALLNYQRKLNYIKGTNLNKFLELNNILLFLTFMCDKMYYFNTKHVVKKSTTSNQSISVIKLLSFQVNQVHINVCI